MLNYINISEQVLVNLRRDVVLPQVLVDLNSKKKKVLVDLSVMVLGFSFAFINIILSFFVQKRKKKKKEGMWSKWCG